MESPVRLSPVADINSVIAPAAIRVVGLFVGVRMLEGLMYTGKKVHIDEVQEKKLWR